MAWKEFWECFPEKIIESFDNGHCVGNSNGIKELLYADHNRHTFEAAVNKVRRIFIDRLMLWTIHHELFLFCLCTGLQRTSAIDLHQLNPSYVFLLTYVE